MTAFRKNWFPKARGNKKQRGVMNSTEAKFFAEYIQPLISSGQAVQSWYEKWAWTLTEKTPGGKPGIRYTPDFVVLMASGDLVVYEVKGSGNARRQDLNRMKLFADLFPLQCFLATARTKRQGGGFTVEEY